jgi:uncharacterized damage-inducible protein DinB
MHIASVPAGIIHITSSDSFDVLKGTFTSPLPKDTAEIHAALERSVREVERALNETSDDSARAPWHLMRGEHEIQSRPRFTIWRSLMLNHWYHHRGQLTVYLRLLGIAVPSIYGPSADESPFA